MNSTRIICFGDSITQASTEPEVSKWPTILQQRLEVEQPGCFQVYNRGISGNTTAQALDRFDTDILPLLPGWVIVELGGNDANVRPSRRTPRVGCEETISNLREIDRLVRANGGRTFFVAIHLPDPDNRTAREGRKYDQGNGVSYAENFRTYHDAICRLGEELTVPVLDIQAYLGRSGLAVAEVVCADGIHLTTKGNYIYAEAVFQQFFVSTKRTMEEKNLIKIGSPSR